MSTVFKRTEGLVDMPFHYCPGCTHGIIHRLVAEALVDLGLMDNAVCVASVGCSVFTYNYFPCDAMAASHGRAAAVATGAKRVLPDRTVFTYQGDGDLAAIGTAETIHAAARGENITIIYVNNAIYGMTGGQMAPTTLVGQTATTSPYGRQKEVQGSPLKICEMLSTLDGPAFVERVAVNNPVNVRKAAKAVRKAFEVQQQKKGFSIVEFLSTCPTNWGKTPTDALKWLEEEMIPYYPLGNFKSPEEN